MKRIFTAGFAALALAAAAAPDIDSRAEASYQGYDRAAGITTLTVTLLKNEAGYRLQTRWRGTPLEAISAHQKLSGWKGGYYFVRDDCLAAADQAPWRCVREHVFTLADDGRLAYLGAVYAGQECIEARTFGCALHQEAFTDVYDRLEKNTLVAREDAPAPLIELRVKDGAFAADVNATWARNQERYRAGARCLVASAEERKQKCVGGINPLRALMFNLVLARYTERREVYAAVRAQAQEALCARVAPADCGEALRSLDYLLEGVEPGELPQRDERVAAISAKTER